MVAGNGKEDLPTPGPAIKSGIHAPSGVAVDTHGDLFISDLENCVVDEVTPAGTLSVVAGVAGKRGPPTPGPATSSEFDSPGGLAVDDHGDLFIAAYGNKVVDEVTPAGTLSVVAGVDEHRAANAGPCHPLKA